MLGYSEPPVRFGPARKTQTHATATVASHLAVSCVLFRRFAPGKASVLRRCAQGSVLVGASRRRAAPRSQSVGAPRREGLTRLAVAVHAAREGSSGSVAIGGASAGAGAA